MMSVEQQQPSSPFRRQALEYIATPKALEDLVQIHGHLIWVWILASLLFVVTVISWLSFGSIATYVSGKGIVLADNQAVVYVAASVAPFIHPGMPVRLSLTTATPRHYQVFSGRVIKVEHKEPVAEISIQITQNNHARPSHQLTPSTLIDVRVMTKRQSPLALMLSL